MDVNINGKELHIPDQLNGTAEQISNFILKTLKAKTSVNNQEQLLYAIFINLHLQTGEFLHLMDRETIELLFEKWEKETDKT